MVSDFDLHGGPTEYWRSDNPFIAGWWRFGDEDSKSLERYLSDDPTYGDRSYNSGLLVDSSMRNKHLLWGGNLVTSLNSFASATSGIAPWSVSGIKLEGAQWINGNHRSVIFVDSDDWNEAGSGGSRGQMCYGTDNIGSGFAVMGWVSIPDADQSQTTGRHIFGNTENTTGGTFEQWGLKFFQTHTGEERVLEFVTRDNTATRRVLTTLGDQFPTTSGENFFICATYHRELGPETQSPAPALWTANGSGLMKIFVGTTTSGLREVARLEVTSTDMRGRRGTDDQSKYTFGMDARNARQSTTTVQHLPSGSILDEWLVVYDGYITEEFIAHYMNSGINHVLEDSPKRREFIPIEPGTDDLVAYWTFDDQTGTNSAPATSGLGLDMVYGASVGSVSVPGIRGGSGIRVTGGLGRNNGLGAGSQINHIHVTRNSGMLHLFPDINESDQWTWIGWMRDRADGNNRWGGAVGWFSDGSRHTAMSMGDWEDGSASTPTDFHSAGIQYVASGLTAGSQTTAPNGGANEFGFDRGGTAINDWQLWAIVWDIRHGCVYTVRDAERVHWESDRMSSLSGLSRINVETNINALFMFHSNFATAPRNAEFDDWAVYKRKLTLPEMSGYALSGVAVSPIISPFTTEDKRTLLALPLSNSGFVGPESGVTYPDSSWYVHNHSTVSGAFTTTDTINRRWNANTATKLEVSGSMLGVTQPETGPNLDFSQIGMFDPSGFTAGVWMNVPFGDQDTQGFGTSGLDGDHHIIGAWDQDASNQSWQLGIQDNKLFVQLRYADGSLKQLFSTPEITFNTDVFYALQVTPSGGGVLAQIFRGEDPDTLTGLTLVDSISFATTRHLNPVGTSGFSLFNVPHTQQGFPSGTVVQGAFVYAGPMFTTGLGQVKRAGIHQVLRSSGTVGPQDTTNASHWKLDDQGALVTDFGRAQNYLALVNADGNRIGVQPAIHTSGIGVREQEYLTTQAFNPNTRRLDLGSGVAGQANSDFTVCGWVKYNATFATFDDEIILSKSPLLGEGYQLRIPQQDSTLIFNGNGIETSGNNSTLLDRLTWHHVAVVHEKQGDNDSQVVLINGRYAGPTFGTLKQIPANTSGFVLGGRGDPGGEIVGGGAGFSGVLDDWYVFNRALTLPEISGLAANTMPHALGSIASGFEQTSPVGAYISGIPQFIISGIFGAFMHGMAQDLELVGGYVSGVSGAFGHAGGWVHGRAFISGFMGVFMHGLDIVSGTMGLFMHGRDFVSGIVGGYTYGACQDNGEFDVAFTFQLTDVEDFDARLAVELTRQREFDARLGLFRLTSPPICSIEDPLIRTVVSGLPYTLTVQGSGVARDGKAVDRVRFTFADFRGAESGTLVDGVQNQGLFEATRVIDTSGLFTVKIEVTDNLGYKACCAQQLLVMPSGSALEIPESGAYLASMPRIAVSGNLPSGVAKSIVAFQHTISGIDNISGLFEYTDYSDQQESQITSIEMPSGTIFGRIFTTDVREHEYSMPGTYTPVWAASGDWGIISDTLALGFDVDNFL